MGSWSLVQPTDAGEEVVDLHDWGVQLHHETGTGFPPLQVAPLAVAGTGAVMARSTVPPWPLTLELTPRSRGAGLPALRTRLARLLSPDRVVSGPLVLRYRGAARTLELPVVFAPTVAVLPRTDQAGSHVLVLRCLGVGQPWRSTTTNSVALAPQGGFTARYLAARQADGGWVDPGSTLNGTVRALLAAAPATVYVGGDFTTPANHIAAYTAGPVSTWTALGAGLNGPVRALALADDGTLYAGGSFTGLVARWNGTIWTTLPGLSGGSVLALAWGSDGNLYAGGDWTAPTGKVARWTGTSWTTVGSGLGGAVRALAVGYDGRLYAGGSFTTPAYFAVWDGGVWRGCGNVYGQVNALTAAPDGLLYGAGLCSLDGGTTFPNVWAWNGAGTTALGAGLNDEVQTLAVDGAGLVYAGGTFTATTGLTLPCSLAVWNGSTWRGTDLALPGATVVGALVAGGLTAAGAPALLAGFNTTGLAAVAATVAVAVPGSAAAQPLVTLVGPGRVYQLINQTTGALLGCELVLRAGEQLIIDLAAGTAASNLRGNLLGAILPGSSWATWRLVPGAADGNRVGLFATATVSGTLEWQDRYWTVDGAEA